MQIMEDSTPFWLVWNPTGFPPKYKHSSVESAEAEAARLARCNPGQEFFVLRPVSSTEKSDLTVRRFAPADQDIPF